MTNSSIPSPTPEARVRAIEALARRLHAGLLPAPAAQTIAAGLVHPTLTPDQARRQLRRLGVALHGRDLLAARRATWHLIHGPAGRPDPWQLDTRTRPVWTVAAETPATAGTAATR